MRLSAASTSAHELITGFWVSMDSRLTIVWSLVRNSMFCCEPNELSRCSRAEPAPISTPANV